MTTTRRLLLQAAAFLPFSKARAARKVGSVYAQLGIRPVDQPCRHANYLRAPKRWDETP